MRVGSGGVVSVVGKRENEDIIFGRGVVRV